MSAQPAAWSSPVTGFVDRHQRALSCLISVVILMALHQLFRGGNALPFDAGEYWRLASPSCSEESQVSAAMSFLRCCCPAFPVRPDDRPGPLVPSRDVGHLRRGTAASGPSTFQEAFGGKVTFCRRLAPVVLLAALFRAF